MAYDFPASPIEDQEYTPPVGSQTYIYKSPRWLVKGIPPAGGGASVGTSPPGSPQTGQMWWNSTTKVLSIWTGAAWEPVLATWA